MLVQSLSLDRIRLYWRPNNSEVNIIEGSNNMFYV